MKNILVVASLISITIGFFSTNFTQSVLGLTPVSELPLSERLPDATRSLIPVEYVTPEQLPSRISDPLLLAAWVYLYNQTEQITIHAGETTSGRSLAEYVLQNNVAIEWGSDKICRGNSCSHRPVCDDAACVAEFENNKDVIIYVSQRYNENTVEMLANLAGSLGHELYHHSLPFGPIKSSLYEEFWAYTIGGTISKADWATFEGYDPTISVCLQAWFTDHNWKGLPNTAVYPFTLEIEVNQTDATCNR